MRKHIPKKNILLKITAVGTLCVFLLSDASYALAPPSPFRYMPDIEFRDGKPGIAENRNQPLDPGPLFQRNVEFMLVSRLIARAMDYGLSPSGASELIEDYFREAFSEYGDAYKSFRARYKLAKLREKNDSYILPYEGALGRQKIEYKILPYAADGKIRNVIFKCEKREGMAVTFGTYSEDKPGTDDFYHARLAGKFYRDKKASSYATEGVKIKETSNPKVKGGGKLYFYDSGLVYAIVMFC